MIQGVFFLLNTIAIEAMAIEIVDLPVEIHGFLKLCKRLQFYSKFSQ